MIKALKRKNPLKHHHFQQSIQGSQNRPDGVIQAMDRFNPLLLFQIIQWKVGRMCIDFEVKRTDMRSRVVRCP